MNEEPGSIEGEISAGWYPDPADYTETWLRYWDGADWSAAPPRLASGQERERMEWPEAPPPPEAQTLDTGPGARGVEEMHIPYTDLTNLSVGGVGAIREGG